MTADLEEIEMLLDAPPTDDPMDTLNRLYEMFGRPNYFDGLGQWVLYPREGA